LKTPVIKKADYIFSSGISVDCFVAHTSHFAMTPFFVFASVSEAF